MCNKYYKLRNMRDSLNKEDHIYKYIPLKYVLMMVGNKQLLMNKVNSWEDPYENFFYKEDFKMPDGRQVSALDLTNGIFGQSWTLLEESDAMWRIYSQNKDAIKIKTTAEKLFNIIIRMMHVWLRHTLEKLIILLKVKFRVGFQV